MESSQNLIFSKRKRKMGSFSQPYGGGGEGVSLVAISKRVVAFLI